MKIRRLFILLFVFAAAQLAPIQTSYAQDIDAYCKATRGSEWKALMLNRSDAFSWRCTDGSQQAGISVEDLCHRQFGLNYRAQALNLQDAFSWRCLGQTSATSAPHGVGETEKVLISQTHNPAGQDNPPCSNGSSDGPDLNHMIADVVLQNVAGAIDAYIGYPVAATFLDNQPPGNRQWLYDRIGVPKNGPSICAVQCMAIPSDRDVTKQTCYSESGGDGEKCFGGDGNDKNWFAVVNTSFARRGNAQLFCATGKNWSENRDRLFWLKAEW